VLRRGEKYKEGDTDTGQQEMEDRGGNGKREKQMEMEGQGEEHMAKSVRCCRRAMRSQQKQDNTISKVVDSPSLFPVKLLQILSLND
jgi:hypothetical protein